MRRLAVVLVTAIATAFGLGAVTASARTSTPTIGVHTVTLDPAMNYSLVPDVLSVFVDTGSASNSCLATFGDTNVAPYLDTIVCMGRTPTFDGLLVSGVWLRLRLHEALPSDWMLSVNVYQEGARYWGDPVYCDVGEGAC